MKGTLYGIGVGPGDPELLTFQAARIINESPVIAYPAPETGNSLSRQIANKYIPPGRTEIIIRTPMEVGSFPANEVYNEYAGQISNHLMEERDVAVLCEGDPFLYGSFMYIFLRLSDNFRTEVVPGVSSIGACSAAAGWPLVSRNQTLLIIPATLKFDDLIERISKADTVAIMKIGKHFDKVRAVIKRLRLCESSCYVEHASMIDQKVFPLNSIREMVAPYFSMILVRKLDR